MDPIADMVTRMRNALRVRKELVEVPASRIKKEIARVLKEEGYISNYRVFENNRGGVLKVLLRYTPAKEPVLARIARISKPSRRVYLGWKELGAVRDGYGVTVVSTSQGVMTDRQARLAKQGGEALVRVW
jgi:small subunit ribosomal protein S8